MESVASRIREWTPGWTDASRYRVISVLHAVVPPVSVALFVLTDIPLVRAMGLGLLVFTLSSQLMTRECLMSLLEEEFSKGKWSDLFSTVAGLLGWTITRPEKMMFNIGLSVGVLVVMLLMVIRESVLWLGPILALLLLVFVATSRRSAAVVAPAPETSVPPASEPSAQTPPPAAA